MRQMIGFVKRNKKNLHLQKILRLDIYFLLSLFSYKILSKMYSQKLFDQWWEAQETITWVVLYSYVLPQFPVDLDVQSFHLI